LVVQQKRVISRNTLGASSRHSDHLNESNIMKRFLPLLSTLAAILTVTISIAAGTTAKLSWVAPTAYTDGSTLPATDIASYTVTWAPAAGGTGPSGSTNVAGTALATTVSVPCGATTFTVAVTTTASAKYPNVTSTPTAPVPYATGVACAPNPPSGLVAQ
jgi:hypothetical protein